MRVAVKLRIREGEVGREEEGGGEERERGRRVEEAGSVPKVEGRFDLMSRPTVSPPRETLSWRRGGDRGYCGFVDYVVELTRSNLEIIHGA